MRSRLFLVAGLFVLATAVGVLTHNRTRGQDPAAPPKDLPPALLPLTPIGPAAKGVVPAAAAAPVARKPAPFDRFRKYDELPDLTREVVFSTLRGMEWLSRHHQPNGRFVPGRNPALDTITEDDNFIRQAFAAFALARAAKLTGDEKYAVRAAQTILSLLAEAPKDPANPAVRVPVQPSVVCNRVGSAAYLALAIYELPEAAPEMVQCAEELGQFLRTCCQPDGSVRGTTPGEPADAIADTTYGGPALAALAMSNGSSPAKWKQDAVAQGLVYYRKQFRAAPNPNMIPWLTAAAAEAHLQTKDPAAAEFVCEMADWLGKLQYDGADRHRAGWRGGFASVADGKVSQVAPTIETASYAMALADACRMIRQMDRPDLGRYGRYQAAAARALQFVTGLQYGEENTQHFAAHYRPALVGGFHPSAADGTLRADHTAAAVAALSQFLIAGADR
jgi:hypothetical protein